MLHFANKIRGQKKCKAAASVLIFAVCICIALITSSCTQMKLNSNYNNAVKLMTDGKYDEAISAFELLEGYKDSASLIMDCKYKLAVNLMNDGKYEEAITAFTGLDGYGDSLAQIENCKTAIADIQYNTAIDWLNAEKIVDAYESLISLNGYKDSTEKAESIFDLYKQQKIYQAEIGDVVYFGRYEQNNDMSDGKEDIEWYVLAKDGNKLLLISKYVLDNKQYISSPDYTSWEKSVIHNWINGVFYNFSFNKEEKAMVQVTDISAADNLNGDSASDTVIQDNVFILSADEANKYFSGDEARRCIPTAYAVAQGVYTSNSYTVNDVATCRWWIRYSVDSTTFVPYVDNSGSIYFAASGTYDVNVGVRPALWVDISQ